MMLRKVLFLSIFLILPLSSFQLKAEEKSSDCLACHQKDTRGIFQAWVNSKHFKHGVDCVACHKSHQEAKPKKSAVEPQVCAKCHAKQFQQFQQGRHSMAWDRMKEHRQYQTLPDSLQKALCERCHNIQNKCNGCHTSHAFNAEEAREPESCKKCHTGMAGPHDEMYASSIHGTIYAAEKNSKRTATCVTCHMHQGTHDSSFGVIYDSLGNAVDKNGRPLSKEEQKKIRQPLIKEVCHQCHIPDLTMERFELAEQVKNEAKKVLAEAEKTIRELEEEGILPRGITLGQNQLYSGTTRIEGLYYRMFQFHNVYAWKGAYHFSPDFAHWYGWAHLQLSLIEIKEEARKLRELAKLKK